MAADLYDVQISFEADESPREVADLLLEAFGEDNVSVARAGTVSCDADRVIVHFYEVADRTPPRGAQFIPPRPEEPTEEPGRLAIEQLDQMHDEPTPLTPIARALVAVSAARARAGLSPRQRITIEVEPSAVHRQEELRHS